MKPKLYWPSRPGGTPKPNKTEGTLTDVLGRVVDKVHKLEGTVTLMITFTVLVLALILACLLALNWEVRKRLDVLENYHVPIEQVDE